MSYTQTANAVHTADLYLLADGAVAFGEQETFEIPFFAPRTGSVTIGQTGNGSAAPFILLGTMWKQSGPISTGGSVAFNQYCPIIPSTGKRALTGCTATMGSQMMYYWLEKTGFAPKYTFTTADGYTVASTNIVIDGTVAGAAKYGYLDFDSLNRILDKPGLSGSEKDQYIAALNFAIGVKGKGNYKTDATGIPFAGLFENAGYDSVQFVSNTHSYFYAGKKLTALAWEIMVDNLMAGYAIATCVSNGSHAVVTDGYDGATDQVHLNFGWGNHSATKWYSLAELNQSIVPYLLIDVFPVYDNSAFTVKDNREYGAGTLQRVLEQTNSLNNKSAAITFSAGMAGKEIEISVTGLYAVANQITIDNWNAKVYTTLTAVNFGLRSTGSSFTLTQFSGSLSVSGKSAYAIYNSVTSGTITIDTKSGMLVANASSGGYGYGILASAAKTTVVSLAGGVVFGGTYLVSGQSAKQSTRSLTDSLWDFVKNGVTIAQDILASATGYAFYGSAGNDSISLGGNAVMLGNIALFAGRNSITVDSTAKFYGAVTGSNISVNLTLAGQSSGAMLNLSAAGNLAEAAFTINLDGARDGIYTLIQSNVDLSWLNSLIFKVIMGKQTYNVRISDTFARCEFADFTLTNNALLTVEVKSKKAYDYASVAVTDGYSVTISWVYDSHVTSYTLRVDDQEYQLTGNSYTINNLNMGSHTYQLMAHGVSEEWSAVKSFQIFDSTPPVLDGLPTAVVDAYDVAISWNAAADNVAVAGYILKIGSLTYDVKSLSHVVTDFAAGTHIYQVQAYDAAGNKSEWSTAQTFEIQDIIAPTISNILPSTTAPTNRNITLKAEFADNVGITLQQYRLGENGQWLDYAGAVTVTENTTVYFRAADAAGNVAEAQYTVTNIDKNAPDENGPGSVSPVLTVKQYDAVLKWGKVAGSGISYEIRLDNSSRIVKGTGATLKNLALGDHTYSVRAVDGWRRRGAWSDTRTFTIVDVTAPTVKKLAAALTGYELRLSWQGEDKKGSIVSYQIKYDGATRAELTGEAGSVSLALGESDVGKHTIEVFAFDGFNYSKAAKKSITVKDATPPGKVIGLSNAAVSDPK